MDWEESFQNVANDVATFLPKLVAFLVILVVGLLIAKAIAKGLNAVLERVGFDKAVERGGIKNALANSEYDASDIAAKIVFYALALFVLQLSFSVFGTNAVSDLLDGVIAFLPKLFVALVIVVVAAAIAEAVKDIVRNALGGTSYGALLATLSKVAILAIGVIAALNQINVATTVTTPILVAILATIGGIMVVGVGGGLVRPMQGRWESWLTTAEQEARALDLKNRVETAPGTETHGTTN
jgi:Mechanosensitive ion channel, conserved TM helix